MSNHNSSPLEQAFGLLFAALLAGWLFVRNLYLQSLDYDGDDSQAHDQD